MDLQISSETFTTVDWTWLASKFGVDTAKSATVLLSACDEETHYPEGRLKPGLILAHFTSGANNGLWAPYVEDNAAGTGLAVAAGIVLDGFRVRRDSAGALVATVTAGAVILAGVPLQVYVSELPGLLLDDGTTAYAPLAADLPAGFVAVDLM